MLVHEVQNAIRAKILVDPNNLGVNFYALSTKGRVNVCAIVATKNGNTHTHESSGEFIQDALVNLAKQLGC